MELKPLESKFFTPSKENQTLGMIFAYSCKTNQINMICILDKGVILYIDKRGMNQITLMPSENTIYTKVESQENVEKNLTPFYLLLQHHLNLFVKVSPNLLLYAQRGGFFEQCYTSTSLNMMDNQTAWNIGNGTLPAEEIKKMDELCKILAGNSKIDEQEREEAQENAKNIFQKISKNE